MGRHIFFPLENRERHPILLKSVTDIFFPLENREGHPILLKLVRDKV